MNKKNNDNLEHKKVDNLRNNINIWIKVTGILVLVLIIMGIANNKNVENDNDRESVITYEASAAKRLNAGTDGRIYEEHDNDEVEEVLEERFNDKVKSETNVDKEIKESSDKKVDANTKKESASSNQNKAKKVVEAKVNNKKLVEGKICNDNIVATKKPNNTQNKANQKISKISYISRDKAKSIAFNNAGVSSSNIRDLEVELDYENGRRVYEVGFESGNVEYSFEIDAQSGKILRKEKDVEHRDYDDRDDRYDD